MDVFKTVQPNYFRFIQDFSKTWKFLEKLMQRNKYISKIVTQTYCKQNIIKTIVSVEPLSKGPGPAILKKGENNTRNFRDGFAYFWEFSRKIFLMISWNSFKKYFKKLWRRSLLDGKRKWRISNKIGKIFYIALFTHNCRKSVQCLTYLDNDFHHLWVSTHTKIMKTISVTSI